MKVKMPWNPEHYMKKDEVLKILEDNKITNVVPLKKMICPNCEGHGSTTHVFEAEESEVPCKACEAQGQVSADKYFLQTYEDKDWKNEWSDSYYHGPCLDFTLFRELRIML